MLLKQEDITGYGETIVEWIQELLRNAPLGLSTENAKLLDGFVLVAKPRQQRWSIAIES